MKKALNILVKPSVKNAILAVFTIAISILVGILGNWNPEQSNFIWKVVVLTCCIVFYIVALVKYTTFEVNQRKSIEVLERQIKTSEELLISIASICESNASAVNACIHQVNETNNINLGIWSFRSACRSICTHMYGNICSLGDIKNIVLHISNLSKMAIIKMKLSCLNMLIKTDRHRVFMINQDSSRTLISEYAA